ncbi:hypothetical protein IEQ34_007141 [Dendrobium chrysotoxum]|uniref:Uncharacterized protein n=1 Tax=Dendrobium chrysotoxum TaxID=161865 RepID=A0AAV7GR95_DENCH|nr:hypothetical protein IEQ34_007141 [Dendrobium chrysotoxum]
MVITSSEFVRDIFKTHDLKFDSRPNLIAGKIILYSYVGFGFAPYLKVSYVFKFIREEEGNNLVEKIMMVKRSYVNLLEMILSLSNVTIVRAAFRKGSAQKRGFSWR